MSRTLDPVDQLRRWQQELARRRVAVVDAERAVQQWEQKAKQQQGRRVQP